jgi:glyoxylase-like metal-dependent hydrolase (beta-lactamase superfamily II)
VARRQEQETARTEVTEVAPGVLRMQLPISMPGLGHVNCYALLDREGAAVVDPGLPGPATWRALQDRLKQAGLRVRDVHTVIVTHSHPDHFGGASRFAKEAGSRVVAHRAFAFGPYGPAPKEPEVSVDDLSAQAHSSPSAEAGEAPAREPAPAAGPEATARSEPPQLFSMMARWRGPSPWGGSGPRPPLRSMLRWTLMRMRGKGSFVPEISHPVEHGDVLLLCGREWFVFHTPGHTQDHFCLHDPDSGVFIAGDHVLPTITPHISGISSAPDPLSSFFYSLDRVGEISGVKQVLPAHGHPFADLRARTEAIKRHHFERLERVKAISRELGPATVEAFSQRLFQPRSWGGMAESETYAHLEHLRIAGQAERHKGPDGKLLYTVG